MGVDQIVVKELKLAKHSVHAGYMQFDGIYMKYYLITVENEESPSGEEMHAGIS